MNFLLEEGFEEELIEKMRKKYDESTIDIFRLERENVCDVIHYFQRIGIEKIEDLLLSRIEIFTKDINEIKEIFLKYNIKQVVDEINKDLNTIDYL